MSEARGNSLPAWQAWLVAAFATLAMSVSYIDRQIFSVLGKSVREALHLDMQSFGWLASAFSIAYLVGAPLAGIVVDKVGARLSLVVAMLIWSAVSASHALVGSFQVLFALRIALGTAESPSFPSAAQSIRRVLPPRHRAAGYGLLFTGSSIGAMIAAPLAVHIATHHGWRTAFFIGSLVGLVWLPCWLVVTGMKGVKERLATPDLDAKETSTVSRWTLLREPALHRAIVLIVCVSPAIMFVLIFFPQFVEKTFDVPESGIAHYAWMPPLFFDLGAVVFGAIASWRDPTPTRSVVRSQPELIAAAGFFVSMLALASLVHGPWGATIACSVALVGGGAINSRVTSDMVARIDPAHVSTAGGLCAAAQSIAYVIAAPLVGRSFDHTKSFAHALVTVGCLVLPGALAWILWPVQKKESVLA